MLDEGFEALDPEALDTDALSLDGLHQQEVGVVTDVESVPKRLPSLLQVRNLLGSSTIQRCPQWVMVTPQRESAKAPSILPARCRTTSETSPSGPHAGPCWQERPLC